MTTLRETNPTLGGHKRRRGLRPQAHLWFRRARTCRCQKSSVSGPAVDLLCGSYRSLVWKGLWGREVGAGRGGALTSAKQVRPHPAVLEQDEKPF